MTLKEKRNQERIKNNGQTIFRNEDKKEHESK